IFCHGVIESMNSTEQNAIFVKGELRRLNFTKGNVIEATGLPDGAFFENNTFVNRRALPGRSKSDRLLEMDPAPIDSIKRFDPSQYGLAFSFVDGDARVDQLIEGKAFAKAGLVKGDLILAVEKTKFLAADVFVSKIRQSVAKGMASLKIQRG